MRNILITTALAAVIASPAFAGGKPEPKPTTPPSPGMNQTVNVGPAAAAADATANALGVGVGVGGAGGKGGDAKASSSSGVVGSGNSSSNSGVYGSGNSTNIVDTDLRNTNTNVGLNKQGQGQLQGQQQATSSTATVGDTLSSSSIGDTTATSSSDNANNASQSTHVDARTFNPEAPVSTAVGSVTFQPNCMSGNAAGVQGRDLGISLGFGRTVMWCRIQTTAQTLHGFGETAGALRVMCLDDLVRKANPKLCARDEGAAPQVKVEYRDRVVYRDPPPLIPADGKGKQPRN